jgi:hypothetical protein
LFRLLTLPRFIAETLGFTEGPRIIRELLRRIPVQAGNTGTVKPMIRFRRNIDSPVKVSTNTARYPGFLRTLLNTVTSGDYPACSVVWFRRLPERGTAADKNRHIGGYIRGLYTAAGGMAGTGHRAEYRRKQTDTVTGYGVSLRHLFVFIRLVTIGLIRDYILLRFLISKEDLVLKSPVCREIVLESTLH